MYNKKKIQSMNTQTVKAQRSDPENVESERVQMTTQQKQQLQSYKNQQSNRGVCYISRIPPYMKPDYIRKLLSEFGVERIYLLKQAEWVQKNRVKNGGNKRTCYKEGWVQFSDKRMAKLAALTLNGQKMVQKKHNFYSQDIWNLKYLAKFKWHNLTERLAHEQRMKKQRLKMELEQEKKIEDFYSQKIHKSKLINKIVQNKKKKGKSLKGSTSRREFQQAQMVPQQKDE